MKNKKFSFFVFFLIFPFIIPMFFLTFSFVRDIVRGWKIIDGIIALTIIIKKKKINFTVLLLTLFYGVIIVSSFFHQLSIVSLLEDLSFLYIISYVTDEKRNRNDFLYTYIFIMTIFVIINFVTMIVYPNGLYSSSLYDLNWFLGYKNGIIRKILPFIVILLYHKYDEKRKLTFFERMGLICSILSILLSKSINNYIGVFVFFVALLIMKKSKFVKVKSKLTSIFVLYVILSIILLKTNLISNISYLINTVLNKYASMSGRFAIWDISMNLIKKSPIIGYGGLDPRYFSNFAISVSHPHNLLLYMFLQGGISCLILLYATMRKIDKKCVNKNNNTNVFFAYYVSSFATGLLESLIGSTFLIPFLMVIYNINKEEKEI